MFQQAWVGRGLAIGDIDNDGRLDAVVTTNDGPVYILHNETPTQNHWLTAEACRAQEQSRRDRRRGQSHDELRARSSPP